jgi:hypothetical protein
MGDGADGHTRQAGGAGPDSAGGAAGDTGGVVSAAAAALAGTAAVDGVPCTGDVATVVPSRGCSGSGGGWDTDV